MDVDAKAVVLLAAMAWTAVAFLKHMAAKDYASAKTLGVIVAVCVGGAFLLREAEVAFVGFNAAKTILAGYIASSALRVAYETKKAIDSNDSAKEPSLFSNAPPQA